MEVLNRKHVLSPGNNFRGMSYGDLVIRWTRWLLSAHVNNPKDGDFLFMRGNLGHHTEPDSYYRSEKITVEVGAAILIPIITTFFRIGDSYERGIIENEATLRRALDDHVGGAGPFWATIKLLSFPGQPTKRIVGNLEDFRIESSPYLLDVSEKNPYLEQMDVIIKPGRATALAGGYFVLLKDLPPLHFSIRFGGKGFGNFFTDSVYEIVINEKISNAIKDISGFRKSPDNLT